MRVVILLVLFIGLYETRTKHYLVETRDDTEDGTDYKTGRHGKHFTLYKVINND